MNNSRRSGRINVKALLILILVVVLLGCGAVVARHVRKRVIAERALAAGKAALEAEDWPEASRQLRRYLLRYPDDKEMVLRYAEAKLAIRPLTPENIVGAIGEYRRLLRTQPGDAHLCHELGKLYVSIGDFVEAAYVCRQRLDVDPSDPVALFWLGRAHRSQGDTDEARRVFEQLVEQHPDQVKAYGFLAGIAMEKDSVSAESSAMDWLDRGVNANPESAEALIQRARFHRTVRGDESQARADLEAAEAASLSDPVIWLGLATEWLSLGETTRSEAALDALEQAVGEPNDPFGSGSDAFALSKFSVAGKVALMSEQREKGVRLADRALVELPENRQRQFLPLVIDLYLAADRIEDARGTVESYREATANLRVIDTPASERLALLDATVARAERRYYAVIDSLEDVVALRPEKAAAWRLLWEAYEATGQGVRAKRALEAYVTLEPGDAQTTLTLCQTYRHRDWGRALMYARRAERLAPDDSAAVLLRIEAMLFGGRGSVPDEAETSALSDELEVLGARQPHDTRVRLLQALIAYRSGQLDEAAAILEQAIHDGDKPLAAYLQLAGLRASQGRFDEAVDIYRRAITDHSDLAAPRIALARFQLGTESPESETEARDTLTRATDELEGGEKETVVYALSQFELLHGDRTRAVELLKDRASLRPEAVQPRLDLLSIPEVQGDADWTQRLVDELRGIEGERGLRWRIEQVRHWLWNDEWPQHQNEIEEMMAQCIQTDPRQPLPLLLLGQLHELEGRGHDAEDAYRRAVEADPHQPAAVHRLLTLLEREGRFDEAAAVLDRLPEGVAGLGRHRAQVALGLGETGTATELLREQIAVDAVDVGSRVALARLTYEHQHDVDRALTLLDEAGALAPDSMDVASARAAILKAEGRSDEALALLDEIVQRRDDFAAYHARADFHAAAGRLDEAEKDYRHLITFPESAAAGYAALGGFYQRAGRGADAVETWETGVKHDPQSEGLRRMLVRALVVSSRAEQRDRGRSLLDDLLEQSPDDADLLALEARLLLRENRPDATAEAESLLLRVAEVDPTNIVAHLQLIGLSRRRGNASEAGDRVVRALGANPGDPRLVLARASLEAESGRMQVARELARSVLDDEPDNVTAGVLLAEFAFRAGALAEAQSLAERSIELDPSGEAAHQVYAKALAAQGQLARAIEVLEAFRQTESGRASTVTHILLAGLYQEDKRWDTARERLDEAAAIAPGNQAVFVAEMRWLAGQRKFDDLSRRVSDRRARGGTEEPATLLATAGLLSISGETRHLLEARTLFVQAVTSDPDLVEGHLGLARVAYRLGELEETVEAYRQVLSLEPYHRQALNDLGWILGVEQEKPSEAISLVNRGVTRYPDDPHLLDTRGVLLTHLGRLAEAREDLEACIQATSDLPATRARALLHLARVDVEQGQEAVAGKRLDEVEAIDREHQVLTDEDRREIQKLRSSEP